MSRTLYVNDGRDLVTVACGPVGRRIKLELHAYQPDARPDCAAVDLTEAEAREVAAELLNRAGPFSRGRG